MTELIALSGSGMTGIAPITHDTRANDSVHYSTSYDRMESLILPWMKGFEKRYASEHVEDIVRCVCGFSCPDELEEREMVQCDHCLNWQHIPCLDLSTNDIESEYYFCHLCLPDRHKNRLNEGANTLPPSQRGRPRKQTKKMIDQQRQVSPVSTNFGRYPKKIRGSRWESASTAPSIDDSELDSDLKLMRGLLSPDVDNQTSDDCRKSKPRTRKARKNELDSPNRLQTSLVKEKAVGHCDHDRGTKDHVKVLEYLDLAPEEFRKSMSLEVSTFARLLQKAHLVLTELQFRIYDDHGMLIEWEKIDYKKRSHAVADLERRECRLFKHENSALWLLRHAYNQVVEGQERIKTQGHDTPSSIAAQLRSRPKQDTRLPFKSIKPGSVMTTKIAKERSTGSQ